MIIWMNNSEDKNLILKYLEGDKASLDTLIRQYLKPIYTFVYRYVGNEKDAEDITQETFVKVWRNLHKFNERKSLAPHRTKDSGSGFKTWIFSIAKNASIDYLRKKKEVPLSQFDDNDGENIILDTLADPSPLPDELFERASLSKTLTLAMEKLSPKYRMVLFLRYNDHFNFREIAESLDQSLNTVKSRHRRALIQLKKILTE